MATTSLQYSQFPKSQVDIETKNLNCLILWSYFDFLKVKAALMLSNLFAKFVFLNNPSAYCHKTTIKVPNKQEDKN